MTHNRYCMHFGLLAFTTKRKSKHSTSIHTKLGTRSSYVVVLVSNVAAHRSSATTRLWGRLPANQRPGCDVMCVDQQSNTPTSLFTVTETHWSFDLQPVNFTNCCTSCCRTIGWLTICVKMNVWLCVWVKIDLNHLVFITSLVWRWYIVSSMFGRPNKCIHAVLSYLWYILKTLTLRTWYREDCSKEK